MKLIRKIKEVGIWNFIYGCIRRVYYYQLQKKYKFDDWHISPIEHRRYALEVVKYINSHGIENTQNGVADIGCGLGDILKKVHASKKIGIDISESVIEAAKIIHKKNSDIKFAVGSFDSLKNCDLEYLITLGFTNGAREEYWKGYYEEVVSDNTIRNVVVDVIPEGFNNSCHLDFSLILPDSYYLKDRLGPFLSGRFVEIWSLK